MDIGAYIAASGAIANERILEMVTHNLANASTAGFKESMAHLEAVPFSMPRTDRTGSDSLAFVQLKPPVMDRAQGLVQETGRALDLAIEGKGYFQIRTPQGLRSVRDGRCRLTPTGTLVTMDGHPLMNDKGKEIRTVFLRGSFDPMPLKPGMYKITYQQKDHGNVLTIVDSFELPAGALVEVEL